MIGNQLNFLNCNLALCLKKLSRSDRFHNIFQKKIKHNLMLQVNVQQYLQSIDFTQIFRNFRILSKSMPIVDTFKNQTHGIVLDLELIIFCIVIVRGSMISHLLHCVCLSFMFISLSADCSSSFCKQTGLYFNFVPNGHIIIDSSEIQLFIVKRTCRT